MYVYMCMYFFHGYMWFCACGINLCIFVENDLRFLLICFLTTCAGF